jgi:hypothetical protein
MYIYQILLIFLFLIKRINLHCNENICQICKDLKINKFSNCECIKCLRKLDSCDSFDCEICKKENREIVYNCNCSLCVNHEQIITTPNISNTSNSSKDNNKKFFRGIRIFIYIIIGLIVVVIILSIIACYNKKKKDNLVNGQINNNGDPNNNIDPSVYKENEKRIKEIFSNEEQLGPKKCKKEYEENHHQCTICLENFKVDIDDVCLTPCNHLFHHKCIFDYLIQKHNAKCPNCNNNFIEYYKNNK